MGSFYSTDGIWRERKSFSAQQRNPSLIGQIVLCSPQSKAVQGGEKCRTGEQATGQGEGGLPVHLPPWDFEVCLHGLPNFYTFRFFSPLFTHSIWISLCRQKKKLTFHARAKEKIVQMRFSDYNYKILTCVYQFSPHRLISMCFLPTVVNWFNKNSQGFFLLSDNLTPTVLTEQHH